MRPVALFLALMAFYVALSGQIHSSFLMTVGVVCCLAITVLSVHMGVCDEEGMPAEHWGRTILYLPWLAWQVVLSNIDIARRVWSPKMSIDPEVLTAPHAMRTGYGLVTYANSITLTPGTVTIAAGPKEFVVHAVTTEISGDLKVLGGEMERRVRWVEGQSLPPALSSTSASEASHAPAPIDSAHAAAGDVEAPADSEKDTVDDPPEAKP